MPALQIYSQPDLPAIFKWQAIAFMRTTWSDIFHDENLYMSETCPPQNQPVHFVFAEGDTLISYAAIIQVTLEHLGNTYNVYGFGNMFTFPPFRKQGFGSHVLAAATDHIKGSPADTAILFCDPTLEPFYAAQGWQVTPSLTRLGTSERYETYNPTRLMLFLSKKARSGRADFESQPIYIDWPG